MIGCGKKGPPLAPLVPIPAAVDLVDASRRGRDVYVSFAIPAANVDGHKPANVSRVDVYGYTGRTAPSKTRWFELASVVASVPVAPPPPQPDERPRTPPAAPPPADAPIQGTKITVRETLTPDELVQGKEAPVPADRRASGRERQVPPAGGAGNVGELRAPEAPLKRFYTAVPFNDRGRPGPPGAVAELPLLTVPDAPPSVETRYTDSSILVSWEPAGGLIGFLLERATPDEPPPIDEETLREPPADDLSGPIGYHVYREILPDSSTPPGAAGSSAWRQEPPAALTLLPVSGFTYTDTAEFGRRRCYTVRAVRGTGPGAPIGNASSETCLTPVDVFPPAPPDSLAAVASEGAINLIWAPNAEGDVGGYVVLRGEAPGDTLQPLTKAPVTEAAYHDNAVTPGVRYVYAVVAVDNRFPLPNMSGESGRVEETAR